jgi:hypothetical protein
VGAVQAELGFIQAFLHAILEEEPSAAVVCPLVVGTDEAFDISLRLLTYDRAAVAANIIEGIHLSIICADNYNGIPFHVVQEIITWIGYLAGMSGEKPTLAPNIFHFGAIKQFVMVELAWQAMTGLSGGKQKF